ncbi:MAG: hypothetical protein JOZ24_02850, partial [Candidatus Eremiobacteraeota bacterium]|nr:hypothetical protein [Candidatus Eremiobacteraeota bacterium]
MQRTLAASLGGFIATAVLSVAAASGQASAGDATWRAITRNDVDAAYRLLLENHPGAAPALRDEDFANRLERGHTLALERADRVSEYGGYVNTLRGFAGSFGDDHIAFRPNDRHAPVPLRWAGYVIALRGENYIVDAVEGQSDVAVGDRLTACDGIQASALAQRRLAGFFGNWTSRAEHYLAAPYLLIDYGNPFVPTPTVCTFERHGASINAALRWRPVDRTQLRPMLSHAAPSGAPGFGVRRVGSAYWIAIQQLDPRAARVIDEVRAQLPEVRAAPLVVVDVRGNGGGNSDWADSLAEVLWGKASLAALHGAAPEEPACGKFWRASPGNLQTLETYAARPNEFPDPGIRSMLDAMKRAIAQG